LKVCNCCASYHRLYATKARNPRIAYTHAVTCAGRHRDAVLCVALDTRKIFSADFLGSIFQWDITSVRNDCVIYAWLAPTHTHTHFFFFTVDRDNIFGSGMKRTTSPSPPPRLVYPPPGVFVFLCHLDVTIIMLIGLSVALRIRPGLPGRR
jgi:hypothetical protein